MSFGVSHVNGSSSWKLSLLHAVSYTLDLRIVVVLHSYVIYSLDKLHIPSTSKYIAICMYKYVPT